MFHNFFLELVIDFLQIELYDWHGEDLSSRKDGGIIRRILVSGEGYLTPNDGAIVDGKFVNSVT